MDGSKLYDALLYPIYLLLGSPLIILLPLYGILQIIKTLYNKKIRRNDHE